MYKKDEILSRTNKGMDVFKHYIPGQWRVGRNFLNPLYEDRKASCNIYYDRRSDSYKMKDFGDDSYSGDCFHFVAMLNNLDCKQPTDFVEVLKIIDRDLSLGFAENNPIPVHTTKRREVQVEIPERKSKPYNFTEKRFTVQEMRFWGQYGISEEILQVFKVCSLQEFDSEREDGTPYSIHASESEPMYGYKGKKYIKIYRPGSQMRFLYGGNLTENYCFGLEQLPAKGDTLFITGGEKDVLSLAARGFFAISFNSETAHIPQSIVHSLSFRFKHIVLLYDADKTGKESSKKHEKALSEYSVKRLLLPLSGDKEDKDISDYFRAGNTRENFLKLFIDLLDDLYTDTLTMLRSCEIDFNNPPPTTQQIISAGDVPLGTQGDILTVTGGEGTGKSNYVAALIAGAIRKENTHVDTLGVHVLENTKRKAILLYDTEQSARQLFKNSENLLRRAEQTEKPEEFKVFSLAGMSRKERLQSIVQSMDKFHYEFGGIQLVVIDGIADLVKSANDEAESIAIIDELYRLAGIYQTCIVAVLHYVPNGLKLRGHLGSELQRKAAAIISIEHDSDPTLSVVKSIKVRDGSPLDVPIMLFGWDKEKGMHTYRGEKPREEKEKRKEKELRKVAKEIFENHKALSYIDLCDLIQQIMDVAERTAKSYIKYMREKDIITKSPANQNLYIPGEL